MRRSSFYCSRLDLVVDDRQLLLPGGRGDRGEGERGAQSSFVFLP